MIASFIGVLIVVTFSSKQSESKAANYSGMSAIVGVLFNSLSALFVGIVNVIIRALKSIHFAVAAGFQAILTFSASFIVLIIYRSFVNTTYDYSTFTFSFWCLIILNGLLQSVMQLCWIRSLFLDKAGRATSLSFLGIVLGYFADYVTFNY